MADNTNPGNFTNRPKEEVQAAAQKGGQNSGGGFANMDPEKQKEIASKGGQASSGSFEPGSEKAKEAGRKVVLLRRYSNEGIPTNSRKMLVTGKREDVVMIHERSKAGVRSPIAAINLLSFPKNNLLRYYLKFPHEKVH